MGYTIFRHTQIEHLQAACFSQRKSDTGSCGSSRLICQVPPQTWAMASLLDHSNPVTAFRRSTDAWHTDSLGWCWEGDLGWTVVGRKGWTSHVRVWEKNDHEKRWDILGHDPWKVLKSHENLPLLECSDQILPKNCISIYIYIYSCIHMYADMLQTSSNRFTFFCHVCSACRPSYALSLRIPACREDPCAHKKNATATCESRSAPWWFSFGYLT